MSTKRLPGVLAFRSGLIVTDGLFFNDVDGELTSLQVVRHHIRGTQNVNTDGGNEASAKSSAAREVSNIQITETAKLAPNASALVVRFGVKTLGLANALHSCAPSVKAKDTHEMIRHYREMVSGFVARALASDGLDEVACRYARNIANGRWLWRNRLHADSVQVSVYHHKALVASFDALSISTNQFGDYSEDERKVARILADGMRGQETSGLMVEARLTFGVEGAVEVYPSENYIEDKPKGFARSLYKVGPAADKAHFLDLQEVGQAAFRDDKIGNALRTFDTWYPAYAEERRPLPVEPNGANLDAMDFFRSDGSSAFTLFKRLDAINPDTDEGMFCIACLMRGGVYSAPAEKKDKKKKAEEAGEGEE